MHASLLLLGQVKAVVQIQLKTCLNSINVMNYILWIDKYVDKLEF